MHTFGIIFLNMYHLIFYGCSCVYVFLFVILVYISVCVTVTVGCGDVMCFLLRVFFFFLYFSQL